MWSRSRNERLEDLFKLAQSDDATMPRAPRKSPPRRGDPVADAALRQQYLDVAELLGSVAEPLARRAVAVLAVVGDVEGLGADEVASLALCGAAAQ